MASVARALFTAALAAIGAGVVLHAIRPAAPPASAEPTDPLDRFDDLDADNLSPMQLRALLREFARMDGDDLDDEAFGDLDIDATDARLDADARRA